MKTQLNKLSKILKEEFAPVYSDMTGQFPVEELKTYEHFLKYFDNDNYCFYMADDIGYILFANIDNYIWVDYLAVFEKYRSMGFGSKILDLIKKEFKNYNGIFFEVEKVDENKINTIKRKNFYIKNDVYPIDNIEYYYLFSFIYISFVVLNKCIKLYFLIFFCKTALQNSSFLL